MAALVGCVVFPASPNATYTCNYTYVDVELEAPRLPLDANPRLSTLLEVEGILVENLKHWEGPLSYAEIGRRMHAKRVRPAVIRACVQELVRQGRAMVGSKGVDLLIRSPGLVGEATEPLA